MMEIVQAFFGIHLHTSVTKDIYKDDDLFL